MRITSSLALLLVGCSTISVVEPVTGSQVSTVGGEKDTDGDGVPDSEDRCPGAHDDADTDGDGVPNGCDACPEDRRDDGDGDGVCDSDDPCPDDNPDDSDSDGSCDSDDPCPLDAAPDDDDGDGVCDSDDACPGFDDTVDRDGDGVADDCDLCPNDNPDDTDGDGSCDSFDPCPYDPTDSCYNPTSHQTLPFYPPNTQGQWCYSDALAYWEYFGELDFDECQRTANATGTQWFVGQYTAYNQGWIGEIDANNAAITHISDWGNEVVVSRTDLYSCVLATFDERTAPTVYPTEQIYFDAATGRTWHYWDIVNQTHSQAISFANNLGARIINPSSVGQPTLARMTAPTHWCHAGAEFNGSNSCNSDDICSFMVGYFE